MMKKEENTQRFWGGDKGKRQKKLTASKGLDWHSSHTFDPRTAASHNPEIPPWFRDYIDRGH